VSIDSIRAAIEAARKITVELEGATFEVLLPSDHAVRRVYESNLDAHHWPMETAISRALLDQAVVGWSRLTSRHIHPNGSEEPVLFGAEARALLLDARQDLADELTIALHKARKARREAADVAKKKPAKGSSGT
jgi:hypothetical protein